MVFQPSVFEIQAAIWNLQSYKLSGSDQVTAEMIHTIREILFTSI